MEHRFIVPGSPLLGIFTLNSRDVANGVQLRSVLVASGQTATQATALQNLDRPPDPRPRILTAAQRIYCTSCCVGSTPSRQKTNSINISSLAESQRRWHSFTYPPFPHARYNGSSPSHIQNTNTVERCNKTPNTRTPLPRSTILQCTQSCIRDHCDMHIFVRSNICR